MTMTEKDIKSRFENSPFFSNMGIEVVSFAEGDVQLKLPITDKLLNVNDTLHGGVHAALIDTVLGMTIHSIFKTQVMTIQLNIHYFSAVKVGDLYASAKILQKGYKLVTAEGLITDSENQLIAKGMGTFKVIRK